LPLLPEMAASNSHWRNPMDKEAAEPPLVIRSALYTGPTMEGAKGSKPKAPPAEKSLLARKATTSRKAVAAASSTASEGTCCPTGTDSRIVVVEVIQGSRRAKENLKKWSLIKSQKEKPTPNPFVFKPFWGNRIR